MRDLGEFPAILHSLPIDQERASFTTQQPSALSALALANGAGYAAVSCCASMSKVPISAPSSRSS